MLPGERPHLLDDLPEGLEARLHTARWHRMDGAEFPEFAVERREQARPVAERPVREVEHRARVYRQCVVAEDAFGARSEVANECSRVAWHEGIGLSRAFADGHPEQTSEAVHEGVSAGLDDSVAVGGFRRCKPCQVWLKGWKGRVVRVLRTDPHRQRAGSEQRHGARATAGCLPLGPGGSKALHVMRYRRG